MSDSPIPDNMIFEVMDQILVTFVTVEYSIGSRSNNVGETEGELWGTWKNIFPLRSGPETREKCVAATFWSEARMTCLQSVHLRLLVHGTLKFGEFTVIGLSFYSWEKFIRVCKVEQQHWFRSSEPWLHSSPISRSCPGNSHRQAKSQGSRAKIHSLPSNTTPSLLIVYYAHSLQSCPIIKSHLHLPSWPFQSATLPLCWRTGEQLMDVEH